MKRKTFLAFIAPSVVMMLVFIAAPLATVFWNSFHVTQPIYDKVQVETCTPGFLKQICTTEDKLQPRIGTDGKVETQTEFVGWKSYGNVLELGRVAEAFAKRSWSDLMAIDFWKALRFTLTFTLITLPFVIGLGLAIALAVNNAAREIRGQVIFISLLPFIITPVIGALSIRWLFVGDGILTAALNHLLGHQVYMFAHGWTIEILILFFRVWHVAPFAFVVFYAGLQTVNQDTLESAVIDGASRFERLRYVVIPHLMPLIVFVALIHLMDAYRVFEEIVGFASQSHVISLQWLTYQFLEPDQSGNRSISRASASAMLTMVGIVILLIPLLRKTWRDHKGAH
ncbi:carbohydrate ABC transporter permease [Thioclava sp. 15-R06ZXC-3]|uniref:Carbohydrate ABC transporter permease n=1 Tax=Thioclava arctica TaxID=3238301 RepID=A0ABV3TPE4_9RHOB